MILGKAQRAFVSEEVVRRPIRWVIIGQLVLQIVGEEQLDMEAHPSLMFLNPVEQACNLICVAMADN